MSPLVYECSVWTFLRSVDGGVKHVAEQVAPKAWVPLVAPASGDPALEMNPRNTDARYALGMS